MESKKEKGKGVMGDPKMIEYFNTANDHLPSKEIRERIKYLLSTTFQAKNAYKMIPNIENILDERFEGTHLDKNSPERFRTNFLLERLYAYVHGIKYCKECGKPLIFVSRNFGYKYDRCLACSSHRPDKVKKPTEYRTATCLCCGKEFTYEYRPNNKDYQERKFCSPSCHFKYEQENMSPEKRAEAEAKRQVTCLEKYGDPHVVNSRYTREKTKEKLGVEYVWELEGYREYCMEHYKLTHNGESFHQSEETKQKIIQTKIEKYGSVLVPTLKYREYTFPSGKTCYIQGYEDMALDKLLETHDEDDIVVEKKNIENTIGRFFYNDEQGFTHEYFPDIYIKSENKVIEVKSPHTYKCHLDTNERKRDSVLEKGINFEFWIIKISNSKNRKIKELTII